MLLSHYTTKERPGDCGGIAISEVRTGSGAEKQRGIAKRLLISPPLSLAGDAQEIDTRHLRDAKARSEEGHRNQRGKPAALKKAEVPLVGPGAAPTAASHMRNIARGPPAQHQLTFRLLTITRWR